MWYIKGKLRESGDTLVEVILAVAIISLVISGAFVLTNRSLQAERDSQERVSALKLAETQTEEVRALSTTDPVALFGASANFCIINNLIAYGTACIVDINGNPDPASTVQPAFTLSVSRSGNTFTIVTNWTSVSGHMLDNIKLEYRSYR